MEHASGSGKLQPGSSSGQAMDADGSTGDGDDDEPARGDEFAQWLRRRTSREMRISDFSLSSLLAGSKKCEWSKCDLFIT